MKTYKNCVTVINAKVITREDMMDKMDTYLLYGRITSEQYDTLVTLMNKVGLE